MNDNVTERARQLLDAIELPATATRDERLAAIQSFPIGSYVRVGHPYNGEVFRRVEVKPGQMAGVISLGYHREGDAGSTARQRVTSWLDREFSVELVAAPRDCLADLVAEVEQLRTQLDAAQLRSIEARNPGIDMDEVRRVRAGGTDG